MSMSKAKAENRELPKRFYKEVSTQPGEGGWSILLDGRPVKTPAKRALHVPSETLATALAAPRQKSPVRRWTPPRTGGGRSRRRARTARATPDTLLRTGRGCARGAAR